MIKFYRPQICEQNEINLISVTQKLYAMIAFEIKKK